MNRESDGAAAHDFPRIVIGGGSHHPAGATDAPTAAAELQAGLSAMLARPIAITSAAATETLGENSIRIELAAPAAGSRAAASHGGALTGDSFAIDRPDESAITLTAGSARGLVHAVADLLDRLGARFAPGAPAQYPRIGEAALAAVAPFRLTPAFWRRAFVSDIMTWHYDVADRFELHLAHDREFIPWMARRGINAFSYIRHAHDTRLKIDEIAPLLEAYGIAPEYGGHVLQILLARDRFAANPELFPAAEDGRRLARGNLCVSNPAALEIVREGAVRYATDYPENTLLHIWGADVWDGAWCRCGGCREMSPQVQYMEIVNAVAEALATGPRDAPPVSYLAYHDTLTPDGDLRPRENVWVEWAPRERCYSHAIDDPVCETNPRYLESLKRYLQIFEGRAHVFEYYADSILFGGLAFASPRIIASDLRAYYSLGVRSISCLTFGAFSTIAYPVNLETYVRCARDITFEPIVAIADTAAGRHPQCARAFAAAYRAIERASDLTLDYADVMRLRMPRGKARRKVVDLECAVLEFHRAIAAAEAIGADATDVAERELWLSSEEILEGLSAYLAAQGSSGLGSLRDGEAAIQKIAAAIARTQAISRDLIGTWGAYDLDRFRELWLAGLKRELEQPPPARKEAP